MYIVYLLTLGHKKQKTKVAAYYKFAWTPEVLLGDSKNGEKDSLNTSVKEGIKEEKSIV